MGETHDAVEAVVAEPEQVRAGAQREQERLLGAVAEPRQQEDRLGQRVGQLRAQLRRPEPLEPVAAEGGQAAEEEACPVDVTSDQLSLERLSLGNCDNGLTLF